MQGCTHLSRFALVSRFFPDRYAKKYTGYCIIACVPMCLVRPKKISAKLAFFSSFSMKNEVFFFPNHIFCVRPKKISRGFSFSTQVMCLTLSQGRLSSRKEMLRQIASGYKLVTIEVNRKNQGISMPFCFQLFKWIYENFIFIYDFQQPEIRQEETGIMWMASTADLLFP